MVVAAAAADVAELPASEEPPLDVVPDPLVVGEPPFADEVGEVDGEADVVGVVDDVVGVGEEEVVGVAAPLPDEAACRFSTIISLVAAVACSRRNRKNKKIEKKVETLHSPTSDGFIRPVGRHVGAHADRPRNRNRVKPDRLLFAPLLCSTIFIRDFSDLTKTRYVQTDLCMPFCPPDGWTRPSVERRRQTTRLLYMKCRQGRVMKCPTDIVMHEDTRGRVTLVTLRKAHSTARELPSPMTSGSGTCYV